MIILPHQRKSFRGWNPGRLGSSVVLAWSEGTSFASPDGASISTWDDFSGNSRTYTQSYSPMQPTQQTVNGVRVARFDAVDDGMVGAIDLRTNNFTIVICYRCVTTSSILRRALNGGSQNWLLGPYSGRYQYYDGRGFITSGPSITTNFVIHSVSQFSSSTPDSSHWLNGALAGSVTYAGITESLVPTTINLGAVGVYAEPLDGDVYGIIILAGTSIENRQKCEGYLAWKVGIASSLDANHPYKSSPP